ncbi:MAG: hypothetical protein AAF722_17735 [Cyanobacteria bacterium P01_C01_bin.70]
MENASWLEIVLKRLRFLTRPVPLASSLAALLLAVFVWDYLRHPEWFGAYENTEGGPNADLDLSGLTPEEQAAVSGIDNLTLLFNELGTESSAIPQLQALAEDSEEAQNAFINETLALSQPNGNGSALGSSPFTRYLEQYQFGGRAPSSNAAAPRNGSTSILGLSFGQQESGNQFATETESDNPLTRALQNQSGQIISTQAEADTPLSNELQAQSTTAEGNESDFETAASQEELPPGEFSSQTVTIPGVNFPVLPTSPQMSPPPGTTGYTPPASLELMPPLPGRNATSTGTSSLVPSSAGVPDLSSSTAVPSLNSPNVDVSGGFVTPLTPAVPTATPQPVPAPFTAPRAPGTYTGGGYIHTFSNPSGPSN